VSGPLVRRGGVDARPAPADGGSAVLVVEDDATISEVVAGYLTRAGHSVHRAADGVTALQMARRLPPDLVVLDVMLPGLGGLEVCVRLREARPDLPVVLLTALGDEADRLAGLECGADDYVVKPFSPRELVLRVNAVLRRSAPQAPERRAGNPVRAVGVRRIVSGGLVVDLAARTVERAGEPVPLATREFDLLVQLMAHPGRTFGREQLLREVWGWDFGDTGTVTVHIRRLREKIEPDPAAPALLVTVWGVGYRWAGQ
jgi:two-component system, OmpR family, response regulator ResD